MASVETTVFASIMPRHAQAVMPRESGHPVVPENT
jgi:hypothetical protein